MSTNTVTTELDLTAWCAKRADNHAEYEHIEMAMYPTPRDRDIALIAWTVRVLGNPLTAESLEVLRLLVARHGLEVARFGSTEDLDRYRTEHTQLLTALTEARRVAQTYRKAMVGQHEWAGHLIEGDCADCTRAADEADGSLACDQYRQWQREYENALGAHIPAMPRPA